MSTELDKQTGADKTAETSAQVDALVIRKHYRCKGCGAFLEETEVEKYGDGFCHVLPYYDQNGNAEPMPCGPVSEITEPVKYMILETDMIEIMNTLERIISPEAPFKKDKLEFAHSVIYMYPLGELHLENSGGAGYFLNFSFQLAGNRSVIC